MAVIKLTKEDFIEQITRYGFFAEAIPKCFSSSLFADNVNSLLPLTSCGKSAMKSSEKTVTAPIEISTYKNDISRRILSVPNPKSFLRLAKYMSIHWDQVIDCAHSDNSLSPITLMREYCEDNEIEVLNSENLREVLKINSDYTEGIKECIRISLGHQFRLKVDIANCYNTIYTHSITWAVCGKKEAKLFYRTKKPEELKEQYEFGDCIDKLIRYQKNNETNGIIIGPYTSRIVSEILLAGIDKVLREEGFIFKRYVDDYKFFFRTQSQAEDAVRHIETILNDYNLNLNLSKTEIDRFPFEIVSNMKERLEKAYKEEGIFGVLNEASLLHNMGEKGAYKYALKYVRHKELEPESFDLVFPLLINMMLIDPKYGKYVIQFSKKNRERLNIEHITTTINKELTNSLELNLQQETLIFLDFIKQLELKISGTNLANVLQSENDFAIIVALDIWKNHKKMVVRSKTEAKKINRQIVILSEQLRTETYSGNRWLLLYEADMHKLFPQKMYKPAEKDVFFKTLELNNVSFYQV